MPNNRRAARTAPPAGYQGGLRDLGYSRAALVAAVVKTVRVAVPAVVPLMLTGVVDPKLKVGGYWAPTGLDVRAAVNVTLPVNPPLGVMVMVDVFPVVAPGATVIAVPLSVKLGFTAVVTVTCAVPVALL
jgi:hypothetical protein